MQCKISGYYYLGPSGMKLVRCSSKMESTLGNSEEVLTQIFKCTYQFIPRDLSWFLSVSVNSISSFRFPSQLLIFLQTMLERNNWSIPSKYHNRKETGYKWKGIRKKMGLDRNMGM